MSIPWVFVARFAIVEGFTFTIMSRTNTHTGHSDCNAMVLVVSLGALEV